MATLLGRSGRRPVLVIRKAQIEAMADGRRVHFRKRLASHLTSVLAAKGTAMDPERIRASVERGVADAPSFGFRSERHIAQWVETACLELGGFAPGPHPKQAVAILSSYGMDPERKLERYLHWARAANRVTSTAR